MTKVYVANINPADAASLAQSAGLQGTVYPQYGFGAWGVEPGVTFEFDATQSWEHFIRSLLQDRHEDAAYIQADGAPGTLMYAQVPA